MSLIDARQLRKTYGTTEVLKGVDLKVPEGTFLAIMGESGSGKTTLLNLIAGLDQADSGQLSVAGEELVGASKAELVAFRRRKLAMVFQDFHLLPGLSAFENLLLPLRLAGKPVDHAKLRALLEQVGLSGKAERLPQKLSGGEQQRVAIARALSLEPKVLLADEPTGNLDAHNSQTVMELLRRLQQERQMTLVMVTHSERAAQFADRKVVMEDGCLL